MLVYEPMRHFSCIRSRLTPSLRPVRTIYEPVSIHPDLAGY